MRKPGKAQVDEIWAKCLTYVGRRGLFLLVLGIQFGVYGHALMISSPDAAWWPVHQEGGYLLGLAVPTWGLIWLGVAVFTLIGVPLRHDRAQFAVAAGMTSLWAFAAAHSTHYWGPSVIYTGLALLILLCSGWPDVRLKAP